MIRAFVAGTVCCAVLFVGGGCESGARCHKSRGATQPAPAVAAEAPITDLVNLPMAEVAGALYRIAREAELNVSASWVSPGLSGGGGLFGEAREESPPKPQGIDAFIHASSATSQASATVRTMPDGRVSVDWSGSDSYLTDYWRARFQAWLKNPTAATKPSR